MIIHNMVRNLHMLLRIRTTNDFLGNWLKILKKLDEFEPQVNPLKVNWEFPYGSNIILMGHLEATLG